MRMSTIAASALALLATDGAGAQRVVMHGPGMQGAGYAAPHPAGMMRPGPQGGSRWGSRVNGHWWAGENAPGGWRSYRRPVRGGTLPGYWIAPGFAINDWSTYGLGTPPVGYGWTRYYDDAVLVDGNGRVYDCVNGVDWNRGGYAYDTAEQGYDGSYATGGYPAPGAGYEQPGQVQPTYGQSTYAPAPYAGAPYAATAGYQGDGDYPPPAHAERRNSGVGGAVVGAVAGGVAGNLIGGRGNRLAGTLIGAGVGGAAGYAIDRSGHHRVPVAPRQGYGYAPPSQPYAPAPGYAPPPPPPAYAPPPPAWHSPDGGTVVTTSSIGGYYGGSTTVVTVQTAPVVTTTTTSIVEDAVTYTKVRRPVRHRWVRRSCGC